MWDSLEQFIDWYKLNNFPMRPPFDDPVYVTDISYSYVLYREGCYQAEMYLVRPNTGSPEHSHPGVENIVMVLGGDIHTTTNGNYTDLSSMYDEPAADGTNKLFGVCGTKLTDENTHALHVGDKGGAFISFEKWPQGMTPTSVTINWKGEPVDSSHASIIKTLEN